MGFFDKLPPATGWAAEYDRRIAAGARTRHAGYFNNAQVQDDAGNWFHREPGGIDCPCGRDADGRCLEPYVASTEVAGEMVGGHFVPFWELSRQAEEAEAVPVSEPSKLPARARPAPSRPGRVA